MADKDQVLAAWKEAQATRQTLNLLLKEVIIKLERLNVEMVYLNDRLLNQK